MIVTSESGAKLLAEAYRAKWGEAAAKSILDSWYNKSHPDDPRKPSFLVVKVPSETQTQSKFKKQVRSVMSSSNESMSDMPVVEATCGTRSHHYR
ncbi:hypothetical protein MHM93_15395 [Pseudoalteromonas sp. MM17-2]|uniref:hypothetical protein n=1 Tax=Pseudoalteromonas sp. MM17-2 TaxID=2917753 RepID=UPI001EF62BD3|nr:hypothetical protein [Pseudoalteromonas sp. MM17-2]MCG7545566.1 hypothetical protein [Pseudoalteromonas sp. MM17-2]